MIEINIQSIILGGLFSSLYTIYYHLITCHRYEIFVMKKVYTKWLDKNQLITIYIKFPYILKNRQV